MTVERPFHGGICLNPKYSYSNSKIQIKLNKTSLMLKGPLKGVTLKKVWVYYISLQLPVWTLNVLLI